MGDRVVGISPDELQEAQGTPGLRRWVAHETGSHWMGRVEAAAETMSGWHHHGDNTTLGYVLSGSVTLEFGPGGTERVDVGTGEYFVVPPNTIHREGNTAAEDAEALVIRYGEGPPVFPAEKPEPA